MKNSRTIDILCKRLIDSEIIRWRYNLRNTQWKEFYFTDVFEDIQRGKRLKKGDHQEGDMPYISSTSLNNGVLCFVQPQKKLIQKGNCIAFIRNGEGSMGYAVYKSEDFIATSDMTLGYNPNLNRYTGTFITTIADRIRGKYNFGYKRNAARLAKEILTLPVTNEGEINWKYMEAYLREKETDRILCYLKQMCDRMVQ